MVKIVSCGKLTKQCSSLNCVSVAGAISGNLCGITSWLIVTGVREGGFHNFIKNSGKEIPMLVGNCVSIGLGGLVCIVVSFITNRSFTKEKEAMEWEKTRKINNPLVPWTQTYYKEFGLSEMATSSERPTREAIAKIFKRTKWTAYIFGIAISIVLVIIFPVVMITLRVLKKSQFVTWVYFAEIYAFIAAAFIITVPLFQEIFGICRRYQKNRKVPADDIRMNAKDASDIHSTQDNPVFDAELDCI